MFSPSSLTVVRPRSNSSRSSAAAIVDLPAPVSPVRNTVTGSCPSLRDRSSTLTELRWRSSVDPGTVSQASSGLDSVIIPAATVALSDRSMSMNEPMIRFCS